ncbi:hypothetical protein AAFF_G00401750, partial [Aldrovandia affinis]
MSACGRRCFFIINGSLIESRGSKAENNQKDFLTEWKYTCCWDLCCAAPTLPLQPSQRPPAGCVDDATVPEPGGQR